jgi:hypothetical protein
MDVQAVPKRTPDPEAYLFEKSRVWVLVTEAGSLETAAEWTDDTIAFICVEAIRERPAVTIWERRARRVVFVRRESVKRLGLNEGPIVGSQRYCLRDLAADEELDAAGSPITVP